MPELFNSSEAASLALHAALLLAREPAKPASARELADRLAASHTHLAKVLQALDRAGLVRGSRGPTGGYRLARPARQITLRQVYEAVEGPVQAKRCMFAVPVCNGGGCPLGKLTISLSRRVLDKLDHTRLTDLKMKMDNWQ